ncbi:MAG: uroporphyrinogen decarboxylase family protein [Acidobacteria bacterium]|nr:uroporphyrinogen decarboxylase family protein [Acidobacteriota bacterium]
MNGYQRISAVFAGERPDRVPVILHNFMMAAREAGHVFSQWRQDPEKIAGSFIRAVETYGFDGVMFDLDTATLAGALGVRVEQPEDDPALSHGACLQDLAEVDELEPVDVGADSRVQVWLEAVRLLVAHFGDEVLVRGNCDQAAFSLASMMRGSAEWMMDLTDPDNHERARTLLDHCGEAHLQFVRLMAETGAHMASCGDSPAGPSLVSPRMYRDFALPWERRIVEEAHRLGLPSVIHICGRTEPILDDMLETGADGFDLDYQTDARVAHDKLKNSAVFVGNLDPSEVLGRGTPALVEQKCLELIEIFADTPRFVLNAGCAIPADTPPENVRAMIRATRRA